MLKAAPEIRAFIKWKEGWYFIFKHIEINIFYVNVDVIPLISLPLQLFAY